MEKKSSVALTAHGLKDARNDAANPSREGQRLFYNLTDDRPRIGLGINCRNDTSVDASLASIWEAMLAQ